MRRNKRREPAVQRREAASASCPGSVKAKIIGRLLLDGGTVERPRPSLSLELPPLLQLLRRRGKQGR